MIHNTMKASHNWHGRTHRTLNEAFGPYHSANFKLPGEGHKRERPLLDAIALAAFFAIWFAFFWLLGA